MKRREFLKTSLAAAAAGTAASPLSAAEVSPTPVRGAREFYELRLYQMRRGPMQKRFDSFYGEAAIPAMNRAGISPVGIFSTMVGPGSPSMYVLLTHKSVESFATAGERVHADPDFQKLGAPFINATPNDPAYVRVESSLMVAFENMPKLELPSGAASGDTRVFELRTYESHSKKANKKKIEMFNTGEIAIFKRTGLTPVFFGETLAGSRMPNLTYMLVYESLAEREKRWTNFVTDQEWKKLSTTEGYRDVEIVSNISNLLLKPTPYTQI
jgi:hypothetical protein